MNLAELIGMRFDLKKCKKIVYFHENQLNYPKQTIKKRDCQYGFNEIMTCIAADIILFNSNFNQTSFLNNIQSFIKVQPDLQLPNIRDKIELKCNKLYFPMNFHQMPINFKKEIKRDILHLVWPHRWEHDKNPQQIVAVIYELDQLQIPFYVSIIGEQFDEWPKCFNNFQEKFKEKIKHFGYQNRSDYFKCLIDSDIVISTADHEFYGVSM